jgi:hypothetical protein
MYENMANHNLKLLEEYYKKYPGMEEDGKFKGIKKDKKIRRKN